eukprot:3871099-Rhodomonas_salina.5
MPCAVSGTAYTPTMPCQVLPNPPCARSSSRTARCAMSGTAYAMSGTAYTPPRTAPAPARPCPVLPTPPAMPYARLYAMSDAASAISGAADPTAYAPAMPYAVLSKYALHHVRCSLGQIRERLGHVWRSEVRRAEVKAAPGRQRHQR